VKSATGKKGVKKSTKKKAGNETKGYIMEAI
jgi:hypothetical protein